jgi:hypothetical protein
MMPIGHIGCSYINGRHQDGGVPALFWRLLSLGLGRCNVDAILRGLGCRVGAKGVLLAQNPKISEDQLSSGISSLVSVLQWMVDVTILCHSVHG